MADNYPELLITALVRELGWGEVVTWSGKDFARLSHLIEEKTGVLLSESTLRRVTGKVSSAHLPSETTLDALARFLGYADLRAFRQAQQATPAAVQPPIAAIPRPARGIAYALLLLLLLTGLSAWFFTTRPIHHTKGGAAQFHARALTRALPNTVIFDYTVDAADTTALFLQQSWDPATRVAINPREHVVTSLYYRPGYFLAKLVRGKEILLETPLLIRTHGWTGLIDHGMNPPQYLDSAEFRRADSLQVGMASFDKRLLRPDLNLQRAELYNVGNFRPLDAASIDYRVSIKGCTHTVACAHLVVYLLTDGMPISIPLSDTGCVAGLHMLDGRTMIDGSKYDLSGLGTRLQDWNQVAIRATPQHLTVLVNGRTAYQGPALPSGMKVLGIGFGFNGDGVVKDIRLSDANGIAFALGGA